MGARRVSHGGIPPEALEERMLLAGVNDDPSNPAWSVAVDAAAQQDVQSLIDALGTVATATDGGAVKDSLSTLNTSVKTLLDAGGTSIIQSSLDLKRPVSDLFAANSNATVHDLAIAIDDAVKPFGGHVDVDLDAIGAGTANDLQLQILVSHSVDGSNDIGFDQSQILSGGDSLKLDGTASVDLATSLEADVSLTVDLDTTTRDEGVLKLDQLRVATSFLDAAIDGDATYHFAKLTSTGTSHGTASVDVSLTDPTPATAGLTVNELSNVLGQISEVKAASLSISLPVTTDLTGFNETTGPASTISLTDGDLFDADVQLSGTLDNFDSFNPFTQMSAAQFQAALESVTNVFEEVDQSSLLSAEIVVTNGQTLQQLVDVSNVFTDNVLRGLIKPGTLELAINNDVAAWKAITDGSFGLSVDGEAVKLTGLNFTTATDMNGVALALQNAINDYTQTAADVTVEFDSSVARTDNDGNTSNVAALTISSSGITSAAAVTSPGVIEDDGAAFGTALPGGVIMVDGAVEQAAVPKYGNAQEFRDLIKTLTNNAVEDVVFVPKDGSSPAGLRFAFSVTQDFDQVSRDLNLNLPTDVLTNLRAEGPIELTADIATSATIKVGLTPIGGTFELQPTTTLAALNASQGVSLNRDKDGNQNADGQDDIIVTLKDGASFNVNFDNATTVQDILNAFNNQAGSKATLSIAADRLRFLIEDHTSGDTLLSVSAINGSLSGFSLGLTGTAAAEDDTNTAGNEATTISGAALHGLSIADHVQLSDVSIVPKVHLEAQTIDATGRLGAVSILLDKEGDDSAVEGEFSQHVTFGTEGQTAADLVHAISGDDSPATSTVESHVDLHWGIDVDGSLRDRVAHDNSRADGTVFVSAGTELGAYQTGGPQVALTISDARELEEVAAVDLQDLSNLLDDAARIIGDLGVLKKKLPLIKRSISQLVNVEKKLLKLTPKLKPHLSGPLQNVEGIIADALKLNSTEASPIQPKVTLSLDRSEVQEGSHSKVGDVALRLDIDVSFSAANLDSARDLDADPFTHGLQVPIDFDVKELGLNLPNLIDSSGEALLTVDAGATLRLSVGLQLTGDNRGQTFIYDKTKNGTRLTTDLTANAEQISFNASVGPFGASIDGGTLAISGSDPFSADFSLQNIDPATYGVHIIGGGEDGRVTIAEAKQDGSAIAENGVTAYAFADLPTFFPTAANPLGSFELKSNLPLYNEYLDSDTGFDSTETDDGGVAVKKGNEQVYTARIPSFDLNKLDLGANMLALVGGWEGVFDVIIDAMRGEVLGVDIPLIGDALGSQAYYLEQIRDNVSDSLVSGDDGNPTLDMITAVFFSALGPNGANFLKDGNGDNEVTITDVKVTTEIGPFGALHDVLFELPMGVSTVLDDEIAFDLGLPGIGLDVNGGVQLQADFDFELAIGINTDDGVYVDTSNENEIELVVTATLPDFAAKGKVGFLQVDVTDNPDAPTHSTASFAIDLKDLDDGDDNAHLTFSEFRSAQSDQIIGATLNADVDVSLDLVSSFNGSANFPRVRTDLDVDWSYTRGLGAATSESTDIGTPTVAFNDVGLNLGEFITNFVKPLAEQVKEVTDPVQPILDAIHSRVPVVSDIIGNVTWLDLAEMFGGVDVEPYIDAIATVQDFIDLTNTLSNIGDDTWIEAGSFVLSGDGALNGTPGNVDTESHTEPAKTANEQLADHGAEELTKPKKEKVIKIPLLKKPANALGLLTGRNVDLVLFDLPALELDFNMARRVPFPPFPALYAELGGGVSSKIDFNFGYDTSGLRQFVSTLNPADIANGLFISDRANLDGTGSDVPEATFTGYLYVQGGLDAGIFEAGVRGQISSTVNFDLHDYPDEFTNETDGRIRVGEIWRSLQLSPPPLHVFDVSGSVDAGLSAFWKIDLLFSTIRRSYNIASARLLNFRVPRPAETRDLIATKSGGTLTLNPTAGNDHFIVLPGEDANDPNRVVVRTLDAAGDILETKGYAGITEIVAPGSAGDDTIKIDERLTQPVNLSGGIGNDTLYAGGGPATLHGDAGDDTLYGSTFADTLNGGAGIDVLYGYAGDDALTGEDGNDELFGGIGSDTLRGGRGDDKLFGEEGRDVAHGHEGNDTIHGGEGDDRLFGGGDNDHLFGENGRDYLDGGTSDDELFGGALSDTLIGGDGNDFIDAGSSNDIIYGNKPGHATIAPNLNDDIGSGNNTIIGGAGSDLISTGSGNDTVYAGHKATGENYSPVENLAHVIHATGGNNTIFGDLGADKVTTGAGTDNITTYAGEDFIVAGEGSDTVYAGADDDTIYGNVIGDTQLVPGLFIDSGTGSNTIIAGTGNDLISSGTGNDHITTGANSASPSDVSRNVVHLVDGNNTVFGDLGADLIVTGKGVDAINSSGGDDVIVTGAADDTIDSGDGGDFIVAGFGKDNIQSGAGEDIVWAGLLSAEISQIDPLATEVAERLPQSIAALNGELAQRVIAWARDAVTPIDWDDAEAANPTGFGVPVIMPRGLGGLSIPGTPYDGDDTVDGGTGDDVIFGGSDHDTIRGGGGNDFIDAGAGNDHVFGGAGRDVLLGGANNDRVFGNEGIDQLYGGFGDDVLYAGAGDVNPTTNAHELAGQRSWGGGGVDNLFAFAAVGQFGTAAQIQNELTLTGDELHGGSGGDFLYGNIRSEVLSGGNGNDTLLGDWLAGGSVGENGLPGASTSMATLGGNDLLIGGSGEDNLSGGGGNDRLFGGSDSDRLEGHDGIDTLNGGSWIDLLVLDVSPNYTQQTQPDALDGHGPAAPGIFTDDDNATDILIVEGDQNTSTDANGFVLSNNDTIQLGQNGAGQLVVVYNQRVIEATWLDALRKPLVEQFQVDGLTGDDRLSFVNDAFNVMGDNGQPLQVRPIDFSGLSNRNDFVGVLNGGPGNDYLSGTPVRDRLDGSSGSDTILGFAGDDRIHGGNSGSANDHDILFAGQGNDDLIGGSGSNELFAWTSDPHQGEQFGMFVNENGELVTDNGDLNGDGLLDSDARSRPYQPEDTGLNRMLGNVYEDDIYGGTGLDFIFGNGGHDRNFRADGTPFQAGEGNLGGDTWVDYARQNTGVWYVGGSVRDDEITLDFVTEEGVLSGRHVVTRNTTIIDHLGVPRTTFSVSADLDFGATDSSGNLVWNPAGHTWNAENDTFTDDTLTLNQLLPPEGAHTSVIIDALGGDDTVIVGETVQGTVWISAGEGNDFVQIESGNALLPDQTEVDQRNDSLATAFELTRPELPAVLAGGTVPANGQLNSASRFTLKVNDNAPVEVVISQRALDGEDGSFANENADDLLFDINASLEAAGLISQVTARLNNGVLHFVSMSRGDDAKLRLKADAGDPILTTLGFRAGEEVFGTSTTSTFQYNDLTVDGIHDTDFYRFTLHEPTGVNAFASLHSATDEDGLTTSLYKSRATGTPELIAVNADAWDLNGNSNDTAATARELAAVKTLSGISGLTLHSADDVDQFKFSLAQTGVFTDKVIVRRTAGESDLQLSLLNSAGNEVVAATVKDGDTNVHEFLLEGVAAGAYTIRISSASAARYELLPSIGTVGSRVINLNAGAESQVALGGLDTGVYFLQVATPNSLPTVYNVSFDLDLAGGTTGEAIGLADTSFHVNRRDVITGGAGHDVLIGGLGEDWIFGGEGNDVISGGLDAQASDLLFGGGGSDTFQILPDQLPVLHGTTETFVPTYNDQLDGGEGEDRVLYLGGDETTHPVTGESVAIPDFVTLRFNTQLHRYEFTSLRYDVANDRYETTADGTEYVQDYQFFQAINVEESVIDVQAGDDFVRADAEFKFPGNDSEWGIKVGNLEQGATLGALTIEGGDGNDTLFGGAMDDLIDGGSGNDIIVGGLGDDLLFGGGGEDQIAGGSRSAANVITPDASFSADQIVVSELGSATPLSTNAAEPVYRGLPIAAPAVLQSRQPQQTVQTSDAQLAETETLELGEGDESIEHVQDIGDFNADGYRDFIVQTNHYYYVFFGPVDLASLNEVEARTNADASDLASRADMRLGIANVVLASGVYNINGDVNSSGTPINDLIFARRQVNGTWFFTLNGGVTPDTGSAVPEPWPRYIDSLWNYSAVERSRFYTVEQFDVEHISPLDYDGDGLTELLVTTTENGVLGAKLIFPSDQGNFAPVPTSFVLPAQTSNGEYTAAIHVAGDLNNDGRDDIVGILAADAAQGLSGQAFVHYARAERPTAVNLSANFDRSLTDNDLDGGLIRLNDANGDGFNDIGVTRSGSTTSQDNVTIIYGQSQNVLDLSKARTLDTNIELDPATLHGLQEATIELDFKTPQAGDDVQTLLSSLDTDSNNEFSVFLHPDNRIEVVDKGQSSLWELPSTAADDEWHHLTILRQASDVTLYVGEREAITKVTDYHAPLADAPIPGVKKVRVQLNGTNYLHLAEVIVRDKDGNNVALQGTARQSSTRVGSGGNAARFAIDGDTSGEWNHGSVTHTNKNRHAWWEVELAADTEVHEIEVFNRTDCCANRLTNFQVIAYDNAGAKVWVRDFPSLPAASLKALNANNDISDPLRNAKKVRIELAPNADGSNRILQVAELIIRDEAGNNVAHNRTVTQSSIYNTSNPQRAVDENTNGRWSNKSVTLTQWEKEPWLEVELASATDIHQIDLFNRTDYRPELISNLRITVMDANDNVLWERPVGYFNGSHLELYSLRRNIGVSGHEGVVRTLEVNTAVPDSSALRLLDPNGRNFALTAIPGTPNRYRPTSKLPANVHPNGFWKLESRDSSGSWLAADGWSLRLETTGETWTKRWASTTRVKENVKVLWFTVPIWVNKVTQHVQAGIIDENALQKIETTLDIVPETDDAGRVLPITGLDFTLGVVDYSGERSFKSTIISPSGKRVEVDNRTGGFLNDFNGEDPSGTWKLEIDTGTDSRIMKPALTGWELDVFTSGTEVLFDSESLGSQLTPSRNPSNFSADPLKPRVATGRYIRIEASEPGQVLNLANVSVLDLHNRHIAVLGTASHSGNGSTAGRAIDTGRTHASTKAVARADANGNAWWQLDLGRDFDISAVRPYLIPDSPFETGAVMTSVVRDDGSVNFRDSFKVQQPGTRVQVYNGTHSYNDLPDLTPNSDQFESGVNFQYAGHTTATSEGMLTIPTTGDVKFWITANHNARLIMNDEVVAWYVDALKANPESDGDGSIRLPAGDHQFLIQSFGESVENSVSLEYQLPGGQRQAIPASAVTVAASGEFSITRRDGQTQTKTLSVDFNNVIGELRHIEVLTSHTGGRGNAHLIAPDGTKFVAEALAGSSNRFTPTTLPQLSTLNGTWTLVMEDSSSANFELHEFDLILHTANSDGQHFRRHEFARSQRHAGIANDTFQPLSNVVHQSGPIGALLNHWPVSGDPFSLNLEQFGISAEEVQAAYNGHGIGDFAPDELIQHTWLDELRASGLTRSLELEPLSVESLTLGRDRDVLHGDYQTWQDFHGQLDNVRIWDSALPLSKAVALSDPAAVASDRDGLHAEFNFDETDVALIEEAKGLKFANNIASLNYLALRSAWRFTFETRLKADTVTEGFSSIVSAANENEDNEFLVFLNHDGNIHAYFKGNEFVWTPDARIDDQQWHDISVVRDTSDFESFTLELFVDGVSLGRKDLGKGTHLAVSEHALVLGQNQHGVNTGYEAAEAFRGELDNVRIWNIARTGDEIAAGLSERTDTKAEGLVAYYRFDGSGTELTDSAPFPMPGTLNSRTPRPAERVSLSSLQAGDSLTSLPNVNGNVLNFDDDAISLNGAILNGREDFTVEVAIRSNAVPHGKIASIISAASTQNKNELLAYLQDQTLVILLQGETLTWDLPTRIDNDRWHDLVIVRSQTDSGYSVEVLIDSTSIGSKTASGTALQVEPFGLILGQDQDAVGGGFDANQAFYGQMDNLRIWSRARSAAEIVADRAYDATNFADPHLQADFRFEGPSTKHAGARNRPFLAYSAITWTGATLDTTTGTVISDSSLFQRDGMSYSSSLAIGRAFSNRLSRAKSESSQALDSVATQVLTLPAGSAFAVTPIMSDIDGNGLDDLVAETLNASGNIAVHVAADFGRFGRDGSFDSLIQPDSDANTRLAATSAVDVNGDGIHDLVFTTADTSGRKSELPVLWGGYAQTAVPKNFDVAANRSVTGSGDFVVDKDGPTTFSFEFQTDEISTDHNGSQRGEKWVRFTTLGDGAHDGNAWLDLSAFVRADLVRDDGSVLAKNFWTLDLSDLVAGTYFLKVTSFAVDQHPGFSMKMQVPLAGKPAASTDFDQIFGGEGQDWITGGPFRDVIFANDSDDATDTVIGEPIEFRDVDTVTVPARQVRVRDQRITIPEEVISLEPPILPPASETNNFVPDAGQRIHLISPEREARSVSGQVFDDANSNGVQDEGEYGLNDMLVTLRSETGIFDRQIMTSDIDLNGDGTIDPATETGWYSFVGLTEAYYQLEKAGQFGWAATTQRKVTVGLSNEHQNVTSFGVGKPLPGTITGVLYHDTNNDGTRDSGEYGLANWTVNLIDAAGNVVATTNTVGGTYTFTDVVPGHYRIEREHREFFGPDVGQLEAVRTLFTSTLGLFLTEVDFDSWTPADSIPSHKGLWYAFTEDGRLLQGTTAENAQTGTTVRHLSSLMNPLLSLRENLKEIQHAFAARATHVEALSNETVQTELRASQARFGEVTLNLFNDKDSDGLFNGNTEHSLEGLKVDLYNSDHEIVDTTTGSNYGFYNFRVPYGLYYAIVDSANWELANVDDEVVRKAHQVDVELGLTYTGKYFENWGGLHEKWMYGEGAWYYMIPGGELYEWNGSPKTDLSGRHVATLSNDYYLQPERLYDAQHPNAMPIVVAFSQGTSRRMGLRQVEATTITGRTFEDKDGDSNRDTDDFSINGVEVMLLNDSGETVATTTTRSIDLNNDGQIDLLTENGVYKFENITPGTYHARIAGVDSVKGDENEDAAIQITLPEMEAVDVLAQQLNESLNLQPTNFRPTNAGLRNEIWLQGEREQQEYYFILQTGEFVRWDGATTGAPRGETVGQLSAKYYENSALLHAAAPLGTIKIRIDDTETKSGPNIGLHPLDSVDIDDIMSNWQVISE